MVTINDSFLKFIIIPLVTLFLSVSAQAKTPSKSSVKYAKVHGVVCQFCAQGIKKNLKKVSGVKDVKVDMSTKIVEVQSETPIKDETISKIITEAGFKVVKIGTDEKMVSSSKSSEKEPGKMDHKHDGNHGHMMKEKNDKAKK